MAFKRDEALVVGNRNHVGNSIRGYRRRRFLIAVVAALEKEKKVTTTFAGDPHQCPDAFKDMWMVVKVELRHFKLFHNDDM